MYSGQTTFPGSASSRTTTQPFVDPLSQLLNNLPPGTQFIMPPTNQGLVQPSIIGTGTAPAASLRPATIGQTNFPPPLYQSAVAPASFVGLVQPSIIDASPESSGYSSRSMSPTSPVSGYSSPVMLSPRSSGIATMVSQARSQIPTVPSGQPPVPSISTNFPPSLSSNLNSTVRAVVVEVSALPITALEAAAQILNRIVHLGADAIRLADQLFADLIVKKKLPLTVTYAPDYNTTFFRPEGPAVGPFLQTQPITPPGYFETLQPSRTESIAEYNQRTFGPGALSLGPNVPQLMPPGSFQSAARTGVAPTVISTAGTQSTASRYTSVAPLSSNLESLSFL